MELELRFRSSHGTAATSDANFGIKGALQLIVSRAALNWKFPRRTCSNSDRNFKFAALVVADCGVNFDGAQPGGSCGGVSFTSRALHSLQRCARQRQAHQHKGRRRLRSADENA